MFKTTRRVEFSETDMAGIVHFAQFFRYMEAVEHEFYRSLGLSIFGETEDGRRFSFPRVAASCDYKSPAFYEDILECELVVARKGNKSLTYEITFRRGETVIAIGRLTGCAAILESPHKMQPIPIPEEYARLIQQEDNEE